MKKLTVVLFLIAFAMTCSMAFADDAITKRVAECITDNKNEGAKDEVVKKYCECMSGKMGPKETQAITQWEKSHDKETKECDKVAGWR